MQSEGGWEMPLVFADEAGRAERQARGAQALRWAACHTMATLQQLESPV
jgi:hypothetical protein